MTINVAPSDDFAAAVAIAGDNGTLILGAGPYTLPDTVKLRSGQTIKGTTTITATPSIDTTTVPGISIPSWHVTISSETVIFCPATKFGFRIEQPGVKLRNVSISGHGIWLEPGSAHIGVDIDNCAFYCPNPASIEYQVMIYLGYSTGTRITNCIFHAPDGLDMHIFGYDQTNIYVSNCLAVGGGDWLHISDFGGATSGLVEQCYASGLHRMVVEYQGGGNGFTVKDCWEEGSILVATNIPHGYQPKPGEQANPNDSNLGFSLPSDRSTGTTATGNVILGPPKVNMAGQMFGQFYGFEVSGKSYHISGNYVHGVEFAVDITNSAATGTIDGNFFENCTNGRGTNPDPTVKTQLLTRGRPAPNHRFGSVSAPPTTEPPIVPTYTLTATPSGDPKTGTVTFTSNMPTPASIMCKSSSVGETGPQVGPTVAVSTFPIIVGGYHPGWDIDFKAAGSAGTTPWVKVTMPGDPTTNPWPPVPKPPSVAVTVKTVTTIVELSDGTKTTVTAQP